MNRLTYQILTGCLVIGLVSCSGLAQEQGVMVENDSLKVADFDTSILVNTGTDSIVPFPSSARAESSDTLVNIPDTNADWKAFFHPRYVSGRFTAKDHPDFAKVPTEWTDRDGNYYLHKETVAAFGKMRDAALIDGVDLIIVSAFRNFDRQKTIWEAKWNGNRLLEGKDNASKKYPDPAKRASAILRYSSMPGTSRHHWGTDLDLNKLTNDYFASGKGLEIYDWLLAHAHEYGFCQPYTAKGDERPNGYEEEKWHWSYTPISGPLTAYASAHLSNDMVAGFAGAESAQAIDVVKNYVLGINQDCRK